MSGRFLPATPIAIVAMVTATVEVGSAAPVVAQRPPSGTPSLSVFAQRMRGRTVKVHGQSLSATDYFTKTPPETVVTLRSGAKTTLGSVMDSYAKLDAALKAKGSSLDAIQKSRWANGAPPSGMQEATAQTAATAGLVQHAGTAGAHGQVSYPQGDANRAQAVDHNLDHTYFVITPYSHFNVTASDPAKQDGTTCSLSWNAGLKLYSTQLDIVKAVGTESTAGSRFLDATVQIYVLGKNEFTGKMSVDGDPPFEKAISSSQLPGGEPQMNMDILPNVLTVHAVAGGSAFFKLFPVGDSGAVQAAGKDIGFYCSLNVQPTLRTEGHFRADAYIGPTVLGMPALTVAARGSIEPLMLDLPTTAMVALHDTPTKIGFGLNANISMALMAGKLGFTWALADICEGGNCVMADGLGIPTNGELRSWEQTPTMVRGTFVNVDAGLGGETLSSR